VISQNEIVIKIRKNAITCSGLKSVKKLANQDKKELPRRVAPKTDVLISTI